MDGEPAELLREQIVWWAFVIDLFFGDYFTPKPDVVDSPEFEDLLRSLGLTEDQIARFRRLNHKQPLQLLKALLDGYDGNVPALIGTLDSDGSNHLAAPATSVPTVTSTPNGDGPSTSGSEVPEQQPAYTGSGGSESGTSSSAGGDGGAGSGGDQGSSSGSGTGDAPATTGGTSPGGGSGDPSSGTAGSSKPLFGSPDSELPSPPPGYRWGPQVCTPDNPNGGRIAQPDSPSSPPLQPNQIREIPDPATPNGPSGATLTGPAPTQPLVDNVPKAPENGGGEEGGAGGENDPEVPGDEIPGAPEVPGGEIPGVPEMPEMPLVPVDNPNPTTGQTGTETA